MRTTTVDIEQRQKDLLEDMAENGDIPNQSEGVREGIDLVAHKYGYTNGEKTDTRLRRLLHKGGNAFFIVGIALLGFTWFYPVSFRLIAVGPFISAGLLYSLERAIKTYEPDVSNRIKQIVRGEPS